ncbi:hypothetical protein CDD81_5239 [Ophiocordyceps australis]|uniref:Uncharacterized protein n=1 Tax=Ophiocordyceps australis TaxID=1399860 RepID=A0A2C5YDU7_9HYPO|nr:hypothetical protein CDD81_5239 [Ophiocordyceps australis]
MMSFPIDTVFYRPQLGLGQECAFMTDLSLALPSAFGASESDFLPTGSRAVDITFFVVNYFPAFIKQQINTYDKQQQVRQRWESTIDEYSQRCLGEIHENVRTLYALFLELVVHEWHNLWAQGEPSEVKSCHVEAIKKSLIDMLVKRGGWISPITLRHYKHLPVCKWTLWAEELRLLAVDPKLAAAGGTKRPAPPGESEKVEKRKIC